MLYVGHLVDQQRKSTTIKSYISAIRYVLRQDGVELDRNSTLLTSLTKACQLKNDTVKTHLPIQIKLVQLLVKSLEKYYQNNPQPYLTKLYRALFLTAYYGLFRIGELASSEHCVKVKDVHVGMNKQKMLFILHSSKTHGKHNKPQIIKINGSPGPYHGSEYYHQWLCPFQALRDYLRVRRSFKNNHANFFIFRDRSPVQPRHVRSILAKLITYNGLQPSLYCFTSLRSGCASDLLELHRCSMEMVRKLGRWKSTAVYTYLRA